ncbi:MAG: tetratricopeptide repeat protein [Phycisphaerales bacterium]|nr:tetratricopeptide repeat protein [Phycisphaerales bacterium]
MTALALVLGVVFIVRSGPRAAGADAKGPGLPLPSKIDAILDSARTLSTEDDHAKAAAILEAAIRSYPDNQELRLALAAELLALKKPEEAYEQYTSALSIGPREPRIEFTAGTAASTIGKLERAVEHYSAAQTADPTVADYPLYLGQVQAKLGHNESAKASLLRAAKLNEDRAIIWGTLADIALRENNAGLAAQHAAKARTLEPSNAVYRLIEARALNRLARPEEALELLIAMPDADKRQPEIMRLMSDCYGLMKRPEDAARLYAIAADEDTTSAELAFHAGEWYDKAMDPEKARQYLKRAAILGNEDASKILERIGDK